MSRFRLAGAPLLGAALLVAPPAAHGSRGTPFEVGKPFPGLVLPSAADGRPMSLEQFRGRKVLLHIFASW
ncbi:MAG: TlpA family protein disulfide reductase [Acidobacteriota bacterium]